MDQQILPCGQGRIDSVKINPSLVMMRECVFYSHKKTVVKGLSCVTYVLRTDEVGCEGQSRVPQIKRMSKGAPNTDDQVM